MNHGEIFRVAALCMVLALAQEILADSSETEGGFPLVPYSMTQDHANQPVTCRPGPQGRMICSRPQGPAETMTPYQGGWYGTQGTECHPTLTGGMSCQPGTKP